VSPAVLVVQLYQAHGRCRYTAMCYVLWKHRNCERVFGVHRNLLSHL